MSSPNKLNERQTRNGIFFSNPQERSASKPNHLSLIRLPLNHLLSKRSSKCSLVSYKKRNSSECFNTSKDEGNNPISGKRNDNGASFPLIKLPLLLSTRRRTKENSYIVNDFKVPEISIFHSKLLKNSFQNSLSDRCFSLIKNKMNQSIIDQELDMMNIKKKLFKDEENKNEEGGEKCKKNLLKANLFDCIYRNNKRMTNTIKQLLSDEVSKAKQNIYLNCNISNENIAKCHINNDNDNDNNDNDNKGNDNKIFTMLPPSPLIISLKKHYGSLTDIKLKQQLKLSNTTTLKKKCKLKKVIWDFINKETLIKQNSNNKLRISKYSSPRIVIKNDSIVKEMLSHNLSCMLNISIGSAL